MLFENGADRCFSDAPDAQLPEFTENATQSDAHSAASAVRLISLRGIGTLC